MPLAAEGSNIIAGTAVRQYLFENSTGCYDQ